MSSSFSSRHLFIDDWKKIYIVPKFSEIAAYFRYANDFITGDNQLQFEILDVTSLYKITSILCHTLTGAKLDFTEPSKSIQTLFFLS